MVYDMEVTWIVEKGLGKRGEGGAVGGGGVFCISAEGTFCSTSDSRCEQIENRLAF